MQAASPIQYPQQVIADEFGTGEVRAVISMILISFSTLHPCLHAQEIFLLRLHGSQLRHTINIEGSLSPVLDNPEGNKFAGSHIDASYVQYYQGCG